jgi:hypothetical protein
LAGVAWCVYIRLTSAYWELCFPEYEYITRSDVMGLSSSH